MNRKKTCADCQFGKFAVVTQTMRLQNSRFADQKLFIECHKFHTCNVCGSLMCGSGVPENKREFFRRMGVTPYRGWLVPDKLITATGKNKTQALNSYLQQLQIFENRIANSLIRQKRKRKKETKKEK